MRRSLMLACLFVLLTRPALAASFRVVLDPSLKAANGRLVIFVAAGSIGDSPADDSDPADPQPRFAVDVHDLQPGASVEVGDRALSFPNRASKLPTGSYRAAAALITHRDHSDWHFDPGNLFSDTVPFENIAGNDAVVQLKLAHTVEPRKWDAANGVELVSVRSALLSVFFHRDVYLNAGVIHPANEDPRRLYAAVYDVPGFGGDHFRALRTPRSHAALDQSKPAGRLWQSAFHIVLDPESANGHTLFVNSDNNGPRGDALVRELLPELERRYHLIAEPGARLLRGHSSGGLATLLLAVHYPDTFGATWSASPDPVDFSRFQRCDLYGGGNFYATAQGEIPSARFGGRITLTVRAENRMEEVLGPDNTSGQQWDSWQAAFGHRTADGRVTPLFDWATGTIDRAEADYYRRFDLVDLLRHDPEHYGTLLRDRVHLIVGDQDNYFLNEAVERLKTAIGRSTGNGYVKIVPGADHSSIYNTDEMAAVPGEMLAWLTAHNAVDRHVEQ